MKKETVDCSTRDYSLEIEAETLKLQGLDVLVAEAKAEPAPDGVALEDHHTSIDAEADETRKVIQARLDDFLSKQRAHDERNQVLDMSPEEQAAQQAAWTANEAKAASRPKTVEERLAELEAILAKGGT